MAGKEDPGVSFTPMSAKSLPRRNPALRTLFNIPKNRVLNLEGKVLLLAPLLRGEQQSSSQGPQGSALAFGQ